MTNEPLLGRRLRLAGISLMIGLLIEAACLLSARPISFVLFVAIGGTFIFTGVSVFLFSLVTPERVAD
jgi:hypothetical protein